MPNQLPAIKTPILILKSYNLSQNKSNGIPGPQNQGSKAQVPINWSL